MNIKNLFNKFKPKSPNKENTFKVTEGVESMWNYHISNGKNPYQSLCGKRVMWTGVTLESWGNKPDHIRMSFCTKCKLEYDIIQNLK